MDIKYDSIADAVYLAIGTGKVSRTLEMEDRLLVDVDNAGRIIGIEILDASSQQDLVKNLKASVEGGAPIEIISKTPTVA